MVNTKLYKLSQTHLNEVDSDAAAIGSYEGLYNYSIKAKIYSFLLYILL